MKVTKQQFIDFYVKNSGSSHLSNPFSRGLKVALECNCDDPLCLGWAAVTNKQYLIQEHLEQQALFNNKDDED